MHIHNVSHTVFLSQLILVMPFVLAGIFYVKAVIVSNRKKKQWPFFRMVLWIVGVVCASLAVIGPLADRSHEDFSVHMIGHLFLGMLAPLLMALGAPMTLILRTLPVRLARNLSYLLRSRLAGVFHNPIFTSILNVGALWFLYTTPLFSMMHENMFLYVFIHLHIFLAGYLFTISIIYIDPTPQQQTFMYRSIVLLTALAAHSILSKYIYAYPPSGISPAQAELGGMIMYYGGDAIEVGLVCILCYQWFRSTRSKAEWTNVQITKS
ncbi:cytochrome c oxidase assembly protein [Bacillus sp. FJAT-22090]|uniref:cytochrome c oxidase assembly protein n=1 Tax=Bacillus sp. FJAT-22090 TaxID=1581038 RepID=UPI0011A13B59|nr:cytochrome c oxidase assembly protein [Bacillus sp. FJAT-22090]